MQRDRVGVKVTRLIIEVSRYVLLVLILVYTLQSFIIFRKRDEEAREFLFLRQNVVMFCIHFIAFMVLYLKIEENQLLIYYGAQVIYLLATLIFFRNIYPRASKLILNNMCMLITVGFIMVTRLSYDQSITQFKILAGGTAIALLVPIIIRKMKILAKWAWVYAIVGIGSLGAVAVLATTSYGAKLSLEFGGIAIQPSEFVKITFVFFVAGMLTKTTEFRQVVITTILAAIHVLVLVVSTDLGSALIFFVTYLVMLYVRSKDWRYLLTGIAAGVIAAVMAYFLFRHVRVRVEIWQDPFASYEGSGYQIAQSLFSIGVGGWLGTGLFQGSPNTIPIVYQDFMFSAIVEELGSVFGICLILICMSSFIMFVNVAMKLKENFYRDVALGLGCIYAVQVFLTIGGAMKMIPMTGVTLPFISTGGSSIVSSLMSFAIVQGLYILREEEGEEVEKERFNQRYSG